MEISTRIANITPGGSDGWEILYRARAAEAAGESVIDLTVGEHDIGTDPAILNAMHAAAMRGHTGYAAVPGTDALRDAVADRLASRTGVATARDNVLITTGGQAALYAAQIAVTDPGDATLFIDPYYATYPGTIRGASSRPVPVAARPEHGFQPLAEEIDRAATASGARALLINTPNNPTGVVYSRATLDGIAEVTRAHEMWLISDEVYDTQVWDGRHTSPRALAGMAERTLVVGSMSKSHAMTGSRIGWLAGPAEAIAHLANLSTHTTYGVPGFIQDAALFALNQGAAFEARIAAPFRRRRDLAARLVAAQNTVSMVPAAGAMYVMLDIRATGLDGTGFAHRLFDAERIAAMPGESFGSAAAGHLRVALTRPDDELAAALTRLLSFAEALAA